jgi:very-short-patch-repair endonuclease
MVVRRLARILRERQTDAERLLWKQPRSCRLAGFKFRRQESIEPYVVDFVCLEATLVIEADGRQHAERTKQDSARTEFLESRGYKVLRFWNHEIPGNTDEVLEQIHALLVRPLTPALSRRERANKGIARPVSLSFRDDSMDGGGRTKFGTRVEKVRVRGYSNSDVNLKVI